jgi:acyl-CoA thioesterase-1
MKARSLLLMSIGCLALCGVILLPATAADAATIVALGASNTYGKGVARNQAYPAQLEAILQAKGSSVDVVNAGINGDTTEGMLARLNQAVPNGTRAVILQPGGNDRRKGGADRTAEIRSRPRRPEDSGHHVRERHAAGIAPPARWSTPYARRLSHACGVTGFAGSRCH